MKIQTLDKLIASIKKDIDSLLVTRAQLEERIKGLENDLMKMKKNFQEELDLVVNSMIFSFDSAGFIKSELQKQKDKEKAINDLECEVESLLELIISKNVEKKTYQHLAEQIVIDEKAKEEKSEIESIDSYAIREFIRLKET